MAMVRRPGFGGGSAAVGYDGGSLVAARLPGMPAAAHGCRVAASRQPGGLVWQQDLRKLFYSLICLPQ